MAPYIIPAFFEDITRFLGTPDSTVLVFYAPSPMNALKYLDSIVGREAATRETEVSEFSLARKRLIANKKVDRYIATVDDLGIERLVELYGKSYELKHTTVSHATNRDPKGPVYLGDDGEWHNKGDDYNGHVTPVALKGVRWFMWDHKPPWSGRPDPISSGSFAHVISDNEFIKMSLYGEKPPKNFHEFVTLLQRLSIPYVAGSIGSKQHEHLLTSWKAQLGHLD